jgi:chromosomal replication initiator protein
MNDRRVTMKEIQRATCEQFKVGRVDMLGSGRMAHIVEPRHIAMYLSRKIAGRTWRQIGLAFGRHHASVMGACRGVESRLSEGRGDTAERVEAVKAALGGGL